MSERTSPFTVTLASAGTGKTFRLTNHYLQLLIRGHRVWLAGGTFDPATILATTFTRKAAGEIVDRVLSRLLGGATDPAQLEVLRAFADPSLTAAECEKVLVFLAGRLHRLNILTLDALLARMAGSIGTELGLPLGWRIVEEPEDARLRQESIGAAIEEAGFAEIAALMRLVYTGGFGRSVQETISKQVNGGFNAYLRSGCKKELWWQAVEEIPLPDIAKIRSEVERVVKPGKLVLAATNVLDRCEAGDWTKALDAALPRVVLDGGGTFGGKEVDPALIEALRPLVKFASAKVLMDLAGRNRAVAELIARFDAAYSERKAQTAAMRFDDLPRSLLAKPLDDLLHILYFRLDSSVQHLLLDEFQDTSVEQYRVLEPMIEEMASHRETDRTVFVVGDEKQALYGWRGAKSRLLGTIATRWPIFESRTMAKSQRSSSVVLDAVNEVFNEAQLTASLGSDDPSEAAARLFGASFVPHESAKTSLAGEVTLVQVQALPQKPGERMTSRDHTEQVIAEAVERVTEIFAASPHAEIAVLTRANKPIANIIYELKLRGIEASGEGGTPVTDAPVVAAAMAAIQLAIHPGDTASFALLAGSPLAGSFACPPDVVSCPTELRVLARVNAQRLRERIGRHGIASTLRWLQAEAAPFTDVRGFERFEQLLDISDKFEANGGTDLRDLLETVEATLIEDASPRRVRVMTVHKAKGLEFDAVILIGLDHTWKVDHASVLTMGNKPAEMAAPLDPVTLVTLCPSKEARAAAPELALVHDDAKFESVSAELCCLYVGMTRAKHALHMIIGQLPKKGESLRSAKLLFDAFSDSFDPQFDSDRRELFSKGALADWAPQVKPRQKPTENAPTSPLRLAGGKADGQRLALKAPSSLEGGSERRLADVLKIEPSRGRLLGTFMHAMFEEITWTEDGLPNEERLLLAIRRAEAQEGKSAHTDAEMLAAFRTSLRPATLAALARNRYANRDGTLELRCEHPVAAKLVDGTETSIIRGTIDRLVIGVVNDRPAWAEILDFKTDAVDPSNPAEFTARVAHYKPQMQAYIRTVAASLRLELTQVSAALLFVGSDSVLKVTAE